MTRQQHTKVLGKGSVLYSVDFNWWADEFNNVKTEVKTVEVKVTCIRKCPVVLGIYRRAGVTPPPDVDVRLYLSDGMSFISGRYFPEGVFTTKRKALKHSLRTVKTWLDDSQCSDIDKLSELDVKALKRISININNRLKKI